MTTMERFGDLYFDLNQNEANLEDVNLNAVLVELDKGWLNTTRRLVCLESHADLVNVSKFSNDLLDMLISNSQESNMTFGESEYSNS